MWCWKATTYCQLQRHLCAFLAWHHYLCLINWCMKRPLLGSIKSSDQWYTFWWGRCKITLLSRCIKWHDWYLHSCKQNRGFVWYKQIYMASTNQSRNDTNLKNPVFQPITTLCSCCNPMSVYIYLIHRRLLAEPYHYTEVTNASCCLKSPATRLTVCSPNFPD